MFVLFLQWQSEKQCNPYWHPNNSTESHNLIQINVHISKWWNRFIIHCYKDRIVLYSVVLSMDKLQTAQSKYVSCLKQAIFFICIISQLNSTLWNERKGYILIKKSVYVCLCGLQQKYISITRAAHWLCSCVYENEMNLAPSLLSLMSLNPIPSKFRQTWHFVSTRLWKCVFVVWSFFFFKQALNPASVAKRKQAN